MFEWLRLLSVLWAPDGDGGGDGGGAGDPPPADGGGEGGGGGTAKETDVLPGDPSYFSQISPEMRPQARAAVKDLPKPNDLVKAYIDLSTKMKRAVLIPNAEKPDPAEVKALRQVLDIPEKEADYALKTDAFKDLQGAEAAAAAVAKHAAGAAMTRGQAQKTLDFILGIQKQAREQQAAADTEYQNSFEARLLEAMQGDTKKRDQVVNLMKRFWVARIGDRGSIQRAAAARLFHDPVFATKLADVEAKLSEEPFFDGDRGGQKGAKKGSMGTYSPEFANRYGEGA